MPKTLTLTAPDDWHIHLRDNEALATTVPHAAESFARAIIMPNLVPPVLNADQAMAYRERIVQHIPDHHHFTPLMVLYLTDNTDAQMIADAKKAGVVACKLYPAGATTNSDSGVTDMAHIHEALTAMETQGLLLLVHGEVTDAEIDIFDREAEFIEQRLRKVTRDYPNLKVVLEHITTEQSVDFVNESGPNVAATITAHHLMFNRNHMLAGGIRPHYYCLPILKRQRHQQALVKAATSGSPKFFLGTDSAPHTQSNKESSCGCAGSYTAFAALEMYAQVFNDAGALDKLEGFASHFGPDFYGLARNTTQVTLHEKPWTVPASFSLNGEPLIPIKAGETLSWTVER